MSDPTETAESARFERAIVRFDAAHSADPDHETVDGREQPKELVFARRMSAMLARYAPEAQEIVRLAARCQHIERWKIPRGEYAMDRMGYLQQPTPRRRCWKTSSTLCSWRAISPALS